MMCFCIGWVENYVQESSTFLMLLLIKVPFLGSQAPAIHSARRQLGTFARRLSLRWCAVYQLFPWLQVKNLDLFST